jgi:hypothetical protein
MISFADWLLLAAAGPRSTNLSQHGLWLASLAEWLPPAAVGLTFTLLGALKLFGWYRGIVGGHDKPFQGSSGAGRPPRPGVSPQLPLPR